MKLQHQKARKKIFFDLGIAEIRTQLEGPGQQTGLAQILIQFRTNFEHNPTKSSNKGSILLCYSFPIMLRLVLIIG